MTPTPLRRYADPVRREHLRLSHTRDVMSGLGVVRVVTGSIKDGPGLYRVPSGPAL